jgi:hypothetical protein
VTARKNLSIKAKVSSRGGASQYLRHPGDAVIVDRGGPRWLILSCPCGCGAELPINLDRRAGPAWRLYVSPKKGISVYPSVWRDTDCKSHFIIWRDKILMMGSREGLWEDDTESYWNDLDKAVLRSLLKDRQQNAEQISDRVPGSVPWDVLLSCRRLCHRGLAEEGLGDTQGHFKLR